MRPENEESFIRELTDWYNMPESSWNVGTRESKWYAVKDAAGNLHAASIYMQIGDVKIIPAFTAGEGTDLVLLVFEQNELVSVAFAFAKDEHDSSMLKMMSFSGFAKALRECDVTQGGKKFGMIRCSMRISLSAARHSPSARTMRAVSP